MKKITISGVRGLLVVITISISCALLSSCGDMEDNYEKYIESRIYSPRVTDLNAAVGFKTVTLSWQNPSGDIAKKIIVQYDDQEIVYDEMINEVVIDELEIKGYQMTVLTEDAYGHRSVPSSVYVFPNGEGGF